MIKVILKKSAKKHSSLDSCWIYANEVEKTENPDKEKNGSLATVFTADGKFVGKGYINFLSKILVRIFIRDERQTDDKNFFTEQIKKAKALRDDIFEGTGDDCCRMVFGEADNLPAFIVDKYADVLSVQFLSLGMDLRKKMLTDILVDIFKPVCVYERSDVPVREKEGLSQTKGVLYGELPDGVTVHENGLCLDIDVANGQKTGYFLDQKFNRLAVKTYCKNKTVLDCFCNCGGFTVNAATVAKSVIATDVSQTALDMVNKNAFLNGQKNVTTLKADVFDLLRKYRDENKKFDVVILDPPAFTKSADRVADAVRGYRDVNLSALKIINDGGYLVTCSCSHYIDFNLFLKTVKEAVVASGRTVRMMEIKTQSPCHASLITSQESLYLKFIVLKVG